MYQTLKGFWDWYAVEFETSSPMAGIPGPKGKSAPVPVLQPEDLKAILKACKGRDEWETSRNLCIVWLMPESGLRRFELSALNLDDVDYKTHTVSVLNGKGGKARLSVFGDETTRALWAWRRRRGKAPGALSCPGRG
jgi:integrase